MPRPFALDGPKCMVYIYTEQFAEVPCCSAKDPEDDSRRIAET